MNKIIFDLDLKVENCYQLQNEVFHSSDVAFINSIINDSGEVLDVGTGEGTFIRAIAENYPDINFTALDANEVLINKAIKNNNLKNLEYLCATFNRELSLNKKYELIFARFAVEHMQDIEVFMQKAYDELASDGKVGIIEYYVETKNIKDNTWKEFRQREKKMYEFVGSNPTSADHLDKLLEDIGFKDIETRLIEITPSQTSHAFFELILTYTKLYSEINSTIFDDNFCDMMVAWSNKQLQSLSTDAKLIITHTIANKSEQIKKKNQ